MPEMWRHAVLFELRPPAITRPPAEYVWEYPATGSRTFGHGYGPDQRL